MIKKGLNIVMPRIYGPLIALREYQESDLENINLFTQSPEITNYLSDIFMIPQSVRQSRHFLETVMIGTENSIFYVITKTDNDKYLGQIDLTSIDWKRGIGTLGIVIATEEDLGRGIGTQAISLLLEYAFQRMGLRKIELTVYAFNSRAYRCYLKCGFLEEGRLRGHVLREGIWHDSIVMGVFKEEFFKSQGWKILEVHRKKENFRDKHPEQKNL